MMLLLTLQPFFHRVSLHGATSSSVAAAATQAQLDALPASQIGAQNSTTRDAFKGSRAGAIANGKLRDKRQELSSQFHNYSLSLKLNSHKYINRFLSTLHLTAPRAWQKLVQSSVFAIRYTSTNYRPYLNIEESLLVNIRRRLRIVSPIYSLQIQTSTLPISLTAYPILPCNSEIFDLCVKGDTRGVRMLFDKALASPFVVNQHGENLLHAAARYAHAELCYYLLSVGVDGSAYDDRLLTPLDHLARKICMTFAYPSRVVNTIRALVERGGCQPLLPLTSNAVAFYRGPEEGFAWLFASEYAGVDLEERDSEGWTLLGDAAFNFGWWTQLGVDDPAIGWQTLYLLRAGADPHAKSSAGGLTPLDAFLRGSTAHQVNHARKWLEIMELSGINLHEYADKERELHGQEHFLNLTWDAELWSWTPTKQRVSYKYGDNSTQLEICLEEFDALGWFSCGQYDLDIFQVGSLPDREARWKQMNIPGERLDDCTDTGALEVAEKLSATLLRVTPPNITLLTLGIFLAVTLTVNYIYHVLVWTR